MKKILYDCTISNTFGFFDEHIKMLVSKNHKVDFASKKEDDINIEILNLGVNFNEITFERNPLSFNNIKAIKQIRKLVEKEKYDIVHVHTPVAAFVTRFALRDFKEIKIIYTAHGFHFYKGAPLLNWLVYYPLEKIATKWTDKLITMNNEDFERAKSNFENKRCKVFKVNGVGIDLKKYSNKKLDLNFKKSLGVKEKDIIITVIAELIKRKNHKQIIDALAEIEDKENIKVLFVGGGILTEKLKSYVKGKKIDRNIIFLGDRRDVENIISVTDIIGLFSYQEGLPRSLMEGMAQGKPIICTNIRGNNDLVVDGENGMLVEIENVQETINKLEKMITSKELREKMGKRSLEKIEKYKIENVLDEMDIIYDL